ncbi:hypothetical protein [Vulcanococcus sp.]|uniref:hypothetical protein n=1 Tax=Vulcanococcus sp. TaxID=2856995 RepID=UPI003F695080
MLRAIDPAALRAILKRGVDRGLWTVEQLDRPSPGWRANTRVDTRLFPNGYQGIAYRNPLRDEPSQVQDAQPATPPPDYDTTAEFPF